MTRVCAQSTSRQATSPPSDHLTVVVAVNRQRETQLSYLLEQYSRCTSLIMNIWDAVSMLCFDAARCVGLSCVPQAVAAKVTF